jgi:hypothetical protein
MQVAVCSVAAAVVRRDASQAEGASSQTGAACVNPIGPSRQLGVNQPEETVSTPQSIPRLAPRLGIGPGRALTALGVILAVAVTIIILVQAGANHSTVATPVTPSQAAPIATPTAGSATTTVYYACVGAGRGHEVCLRLVHTGTTPAHVSVVRPG